MNITNLVNIVPEASKVIFDPKQGKPLLTVLSYGAGQDSHTLLLKYIHDPGFRESYAPNDFLVVMSDTGDEFDETYRTVNEAKLLCQKHNIKFTFITNDMGYHTGDWQSLSHFYKAKSAVGSKAYPKICSQRLKIDPIYRYLEDYLNENYHVKRGNKSGFREFAQKWGKVRMIIGIADGEQKRMTDASTNKARWYRESIQHCYPLVELGMNRQACQGYIREQGYAVPIPSNCKMCPFLSEEELEYLRRFEPDSLEQWMGYERDKLHKFSHLNRVIVVTKSGNERIENKNFGVWGNVYLPEMIERVRVKFLHWSDDKIKEYRMSHGHCVASSF